MDVTIYQRSIILAPFENDSAFIGFLSEFL